MNPQDNLIIMCFIVVCYMVCALEWAVMACANIKWDTPNSAVGLIISSVFVFRAYRNIHFYSRLGNRIDEASNQMNGIEAVCWLVCCSLLVMAYIPNVKNWIRRKLKS